MLLSGLVEDYLKLTNDMWYIIKNKLCASPDSKFDTVKYWLSEEALEEWDTAEATVTQNLVLVPVLSENPDDEKTESEDQEDQKESKNRTDKNLEEQSMGQTNDSFKECIQLFLDQRIPTGPARKQNTYIHSNLKKPRGLDIKVVARSLKEMSYKIPLLGETNSKPLDDFKS